jgi:hypothetical protein
LVRFVVCERPSTVRSWMVRIIIYSAALNVWCHSGIVTCPFYGAFSGDFYKDATLYLSIVVGLVMYKVVYVLSIVIALVMYKVVCVSVV